MRYDTAISVLNTAAPCHDRSWGSGHTTSLPNLHKPCKTNPLHSLQFFTKYLYRKF